MTDDRSSRARPALALLAASLVLVGAAADSSAGDTDDGIVLLPSSITLTGPRALQSLLVQRQRDGHVAEQITHGVTLTSSDSGVVRIEGGVAVPVADGTARLTAAHGGRTAVSDVTVVGTGAPSPLSFRNTIQPVLTKSGCNSGACHGAAAGKNGFNLSLRGYDPQGDYAQITRHARGRRIVPSDPGRSLVLTKPTGAIPHKGGVRFEPDSQEYRRIAEWIAAGAPPPRPDDARITTVEVLPGRVEARPGAEQQLIVRAHFSDGHAEDVTRLAKYDVTDTSTARIDDYGRVSVVGHGETAVTVWYLSRIAVATVTVPFEGEGASEGEGAPRESAGAARRSFIDDHVAAKLEALRIPPSPPASDAAFLRRAFVDTIGVLPRSDEVRAFLAEPLSGRRERLIESLLRRPEFVDYWAYKWSDLLLVNSSRLPRESMLAYYRWIRNHVEAGTPWDAFARELVTASGSTLENGATNFFLLHEDPQSMAETTSLAFLGLSIGCARCHNHPMEKWTNDQYYGMANLFARVRSKNSGGGRVVYSAASGELIQPLTGRPQPPRPLDGEALRFDDPRDRRAHLARWLTGPANPYFARAVVNRVWANFMGVGLVENVDDLRVTNPASNEALLSALADFLVERQFDLKALMREILNSAAYQRSGQPLERNAAETRFYSRYYPRRLKAEVLLDAFSQVLAVPTEFPGYPKGWRALQLPDSNVDSYFLRSFGRPAREQTCECERSEASSVAQVLHIANGETLNGKLEAGKNVIAAAIDSKTPTGTIIEELYLSALARYPAESERERLTEVLDAARDGDRRAALEDLYWSVLSSKEFLFSR